MRLAARLLLLIVLPVFCSAQDTNFSTGPQYLITGQSTMFLHSIETPSLSFGPSSAPAPPVTTEDVSASQVVETPPPLPPNADLTGILWGEPSTSALAEASSEIELSGAETPRNLPAGFLDVGVTAVVTDQTLREQGYGISLGEVAAYWKAHASKPAHTYTNRDVERVPGS